MSRLDPFLPFLLSSAKKASFPFDGKGAGVNINTGGYGDTVSELFEVPVFAVGVGTAAGGA